MSNYELLDLVNSMTRHRGEWDTWINSQTYVDGSEPLLAYGAFAILHLSAYRRLYHWDFPEYHWPVSSDEFYCGSVKFEYEKESLKEIDHRWRVNSRIREFGSKSLKAYCELADQAKYHYTTIIRENKKSSLERPNRLGIWYSKEHGWYNDDPNNPQTGFYQF